MELVDGNIIVMSPSGYESDEVALEMGRQLANWVRPRKLGRVAASSAGFTLPNSNLRAPGTSFVFADIAPQPLRDRLRRSPRSFALLAPDLTVEVKSPSDSLEATRAKIQEFLSLGTTVGLLVNPDDRTVEIHRLDRETMTLHDGETLTVPDLLPGWEVQVLELWSPEFDEPS